MENGKWVPFTAAGFAAGLALAAFIVFGQSTLPVGSAAAAESGSSSAASTAVEVQEAFREVTARVLPSIVEVSVESDVISVENGEGDIPWNDFFGDPSENSEAPRYFRSEGLGSGVIVKADGDSRYVLTNAHVIGSSPDNIHVELHDGTMVTAELVGTDVRKDLALVRFTSDDRMLRPVEIGDSDRLYVGDWVLAFGSPYGYGQSVSYGIVSALGRRDGPGENINDFIQTDASINQGNSGGALVNIHGELVGINTFITTPNGGSIGLGFAIPVNNAVTAMEQLIENGDVSYGWMGMSLGPYGTEVAGSLGYEERGGALVYQVFLDSPAWEAGLRPGDLVTGLDGSPIKDTETLIYRIGDRLPGESLIFSIDRFGKEMKLTAVSGERGDDEDVRSRSTDAWPGFVAAPLTDDLKIAMGFDSAQSGVAVAEVYPRTVAGYVGLVPGDVIIAIGPYEVADLRSMYRGLSAIDIENPEFRVIRNGTVMNLGIEKDGQQ